jgi:hypothetical protein
MSYGRLKFLSSLYISRPMIAPEKGPLSYWSRMYQELKRQDDGCI